MAAEEVKFVFKMDDQFTAAAKKAEGATAGLTSKMGQLGKLAAATFSVGAVVNFGKAIIDSLKNYEYFHSALGTMLKGNKNATVALESQLVSLAKTTPFELTEVQDATKQLLAYGFKAGDLVDTMRVLGDVSAGVGAPLNDIAYLYGTLKTTGRVMQVDLRQFAGRGIPIYEHLAKVLKVNKSAITGMVTEGKIGFKDIEKAFKSMNGAGGEFFDMMNTQSQTVGGKLSNLGDAWDQLKVNIGKSQTGIIGSTVQFFSSMINTLEQFTAASNRKEDAYAKYGGKDFNFIQRTGGKIATVFGLKSKVNEQNDFEQGLQNMYVKNSKTKLDALRSEVSLRNLLKNQYVAYKDNEITKEELDRRQAVIRATIDQVRGLRDISTMKANPLEKDGGVVMDKKEKESSKVKGPQYTQITINIDQMTGVENLTSNDNKSISKDIGLEVVQLMVKAVEDSQIVAGI